MIAEERILSLLVDGKPKNMKTLKEEMLFLLCKFCFFPNYVFSQSLCNFWVTIFHQHDLALIQKTKCFRSPKDPDMVFIKRIIALDGDTVRYDISYD